ncbi:uncharacterized protein FYW61_005783 [Anableps anableps]
MRRKNRAKTALQGGVEENASICFKTREKTLSDSVKQQKNPSKNPTGRGLGKAGAKRLGRLLKRVIQPQEELAGKENVSLPKTPVRLFKQQIEKKDDNAPKAKFSKQQASKLVLNMVSQCKHRGGISMAELKQTLADEGYDVAKNNRQVKLVTERLVNKDTLVRTTRNTSVRLNNKKVMKTTTAKKNTATSQKPTQESKKKTPARRSPEKETRPQKTFKKMTKARGRIQKMKGNTGRAAGSSQKQRKQTPKPRGMSQKPARKIPQLTKNQTIRPQKPPVKAKRTQRDQPKQVKSSRRQPKKQRLPKTSSRLQTKHRRNTKRT